MSYLVVCSVALIAAGLTFFSGFGLGTLLLPAFAVFFAVEKAVALSAVVHFLNGLFKLLLVWRHVDRGVVLRFGVLAMAGGYAGAQALLWLADVPALAHYTFLGRAAEITPVKLVVGLLLFAFGSAEMIPDFRRLAVPGRYLPAGGLLSGFFGGLSGMQGALRSAFLIKAGLSKEGYIATGAAVAFMIDVARLAVYSRLMFGAGTDFGEYGLLAATVAAAFAGTIAGNRYLRKVTMGGVRSVVAGMLLLVAAGLISGIL